MSIPGNNPQEVMSVLNARKTMGSKDKRKIALVLEGGSLRGVYSCGVAQALVELGFQGCFDYLIGTSSGALNTLYFADARMDLAQSIYYENAVDKRCLNIWNFPEILNVHWMISEHILGVKHYDVDFVFSDTCPEICVSTTNVETGKTHWFSNKTSTVEDFEKAVLATAYTPIVCSQKEKIGGELFNDGYLQAALPVEKAIELGCTDIVVVPTQPWGYRKTKSKGLAGIYSNWRVRDYSKAYRKVYAQRQDLYNKSLKIAETGGGVANTMVLAPHSKSEIVGNLETDSDTIKKSGADACILNKQRISKFMKSLNLT